MEPQQLEDHHMRLPPPITGTGKTISAGANSSVSATTTPTPTATATHGPATDSPALHKTSHQHMHPVQQAYPRPISSLSPQFKTANASPIYGFGSNHHPSTSSPLSPRPLGTVPAHAPPSYTFSQTQTQTQTQSQNHDPTTLVFPDPPSAELAPLQLNAHENSVGSLPSLAYLTGTAAANSSRRFAAPSATSDPSQSPPPLRPRGWPTGNPYSVYYTGGHGHTADSPARMDSDTMNNGMLSPDAVEARASSVSLDDPDVRMAAEALGDLKAGKYERVTPHIMQPLPSLVLSPHSPITILDPDTKLLYITIEDSANSCLCTRFHLISPKQNHQPARIAQPFRHAGTI